MVVPYLRGCAVNPETIIAIAGLLVTLVGTLGGVWLTNRAAARREEQQWRRHIGEERRRERLEACEDLSRTVLLVAMDKSSQEEVAAAFSRVELRCHPSVVQTARKLFSACRGVASAVRREKT
jgi:hypothetical protein